MVEEIIQITCILMMGFVMYFNAASNEKIIMTGLVSFAKKMVQFTNILLPAIFPCILVSPWCLGQRSKQPRGPREARCSGQAG